MESRIPVPFDYVMCTNERVFAYDDEAHVDTACHPDQAGIGTVHVLKDLTSSNPTLYAAGSAVGRVFCVTNSRWQKPTSPTLNQLRIFTSTAFHVSPNVICTSRHIVDVEQYRVLGVYFTPKWRFLTSSVEDLLYTLDFPLNRHTSPSAWPRFNQAIAERGLYYVDKIHPLTQEHANKFSHFRNLDPMPTNPLDEYQRPLTWQPANDFAFLHVTHPSQHWLVPSAICPEVAYTCLIGYASKPKEYKRNQKVKLDGENGERLTTYARVFGGFDVRFFAPGVTYHARTVDDEDDLRLISHKTSCEAATSGAPIIKLSEKTTDYSCPTFIATQVGGYPYLGFSIATPSTTRTFCMEWATHVLEDIFSANLERNDPRIPQLIAYLKLVRDKWPSGYDHHAIVRVRSFLAHLEQGM